MAAATPGISMNTANGKILIAEDSPTQAESIKLILVSAGYMVEVARDGQEGLQRFQSSKPDLVLSDVLMPNMTGYEFCRELKRLSPSTPVILLTQLNDLSDLIEGLRAGADNYLLKPCQKDHLLNRIEHSLQNRDDTEPECDTHSGICNLDKTFVNTLDRRRILEYLVSTFDEFLQIRQDQHDEALQAGREREQLLEQKEQFIKAMLDHLKNPLASGEAELQQLLGGSHGELSKSQRQALEEVLKTQKILLGLVQEFAEVLPEDAKMSKRPVSSFIRRS
jgi:DNA-binding response OmpR family regulator